MSNRVVVLVLLLQTIVVVDSYYFNYYVYAQQWPAAFCFNDRIDELTSTRSKSEECHFASNVTSWTVHGLWPSVNESYPEFCNNSWPLEESDIFNLEDDMRARWPSFGESDFQFWTHEWDKHGTCAALVPDLRGPYNFFKYALQLNSQFNLLQMLQKQQITPNSDDCYNYDDVFQATKQLFGETVIIGCTWDKEARKQYIGQIEVCFDKYFQLNCNPDLRKGQLPRNRDLGKFSAMPSVEPCRSTEQVCYPAIPH